MPAPAPNVVTLQPNRWTEVVWTSFLWVTYNVIVVSGGSPVISYRRHLAGFPPYWDGQFQGSAAIPFLGKPWENLELRSPTTVTVRIWR